MKQEHTPGPWAAVPLPNNWKVEAWAIVPADKVKHIESWQIAGLCHQVNDEANARLIAEAPAMLEAAEIVAERLEALANTLRAAIARTKEEKP